MLYCNVSNKDCKIFFPVGYRGTNLLRGKGSVTELKVRFQDFRRYLALIHLAIDNKSRGTA